MKVLFISGYVEAPGVHREIAEARLDFLAKPFSPRQVAETVRRVLHPA